jgi:hypothetical protein
VTADGEGGEFGSTITVLMRDTISLVLLEVNLLQCSGGALWDEDDDLK